MKTLRFSNLNDLLAWCRNNPDSLVYWGWLENFDEWCTTAELAADVSSDWWCGVDEEGNEFHLDAIEIYVK